MGANCGGALQHEQHLLLPAAWLCLSTDGITRRRHSSIGSVSITPSDTESIFQLDHVFLHYSHRQTHKSAAVIPSKPTPPAPLFQSEKILFIHQRRRKEVELGGKQSGNRINPGRTTTRHT